MNGVDFSLEPSELPAYTAKDGGPAVVICEGRPLSPWLDQVAQDFSPSSVLYVWREAAAWSALMVKGSDRPNPSRADLKRAAAVLAQEGQLGVGDEVLFRSEKEAVSVVARPADAASGTREQVRTVAGLVTWIYEQNARTIPQIVQSLRSPTGVIPFLGAGTSGPFKYPLWGPFFEQCATTEDRAAITAHVEAGEFEQAAQLLVNRDADGFYRKVGETFARPPALDEVPSTPLTRLPLIAPGPVITTNFDPVIESIYQDQGKPFTEERRILGRNNPELVVTAIQENQSALIKLHGDASRPDSLTFTAVEYKQSYGDFDHPGPVERLATVVYTNRPLLFLGCSLEKDRTLQSLKNVHTRNPYVGHYAVLAAPYRSSKLDQRVKELAGAGIRPLWYRPKEFAEIEVLLDDLVARTAMDELRGPEPIHPRPAPASDGPGDWWPDLANGHIDSAIEALVSGKLIFFLGAAVHPNRMYGHEFYMEIRHRAQIPWPSRDRADVAQHVADLDIDRRRLSSFIDEIVREHYTRPSPVHRFLAKLPGMLRRLGQNPLMVVTTNYDIVTEISLDAADEPYHLFLYNHDGQYAGRFLHRLPDGREYAIRVPAALNKPLDATAIIKLNGGIDPCGHWPPSFVVASSDFEELSTRLPDALPRVVWDALKKRSLMFWGHGLREPDVRALTRRRKREGAPRSWAVQLGKADVQYWEEVAGIELVDADLGVYLERFKSALATRLGAVPPK
jgi:hypothetical protein